MARKRRDKYYGVNFNNPARCDGGMDFLEATSASNILLNDDIGFGLRPGRTTQASVAEIIHSLDWFRDYAQNDHLLIGAGGKVYDDGNLDGAPVESLTGLADGLKTKNVTYLDFFWHCNGTDDNMKYDGTDWSHAGMAAPATGPVLAENPAVGVLDGDYQYVYVYVYYNATTGYAVESRISDREELTVNLKQIDVTVLADPTGEATYIRIYRRSSNAIEYQRVVELANANATYTDNIAEGALGSLIEFPAEGEVLDKDLAPVALSGVVEWKSRLWGWDGNYLYHTRAGRPEKWWNDQSLTAQPIEIRGIVSVTPTENVLVIHTGNKMLLIYGDKEPFNLIDREWGVGCIAARSPAVCSGILRWESKEGVYRWNGVDKPERDSDDINKDKTGQYQGLLDNTTLNQSQSAGAYLNTEKLYWLSHTKNRSPQNKLTWTLNLNKADIGVSRWIPYDFGFIAIAISEDERVVTASGMDGAYILELQDHDDDGTDVTGHYETRHSNFNNDLDDKRFLEITAVGAGTGSPITCRWKTMIIQYGYYTYSFLLTLTADLWADATDVWHDADDFWMSTTNQQRTMNLPQECVGALGGMRVEMDKDAQFYGFEVMYNLEKRYHS